jgi:NADH dehydrogenase
MHIVYPARQIASERGFRFRESIVESIDLEGRRIVTEEGELPYDTLVIALGSTTNYFGIASAMEHALPLKTLGDAVAVRNRIIDAFEEADLERDAERRRDLLTFVIVGGGATGIELAGGLQGLAEYVLWRHYPNLCREEMRIIIMEAGPDLLQENASYLAQASWDALRAKGIDVRLNSRVVEVTPDHVTLASGEEVRTRTVIWTAGVRPVDVVAKLDVPKVRGGRLQVNEFLELPGYPSVFVVGDVAGPLHPKTGLPVPAMSATAEPQGHTVGENILRRLSGERMKPYQFRWYGQALSLGRNNAAIEAGPIKVRGFLAWVGWRTVHLYKMRGWRSRFGLALDWIFAYLFQRETLRLETETERA